jgi:hypothetical protein
LKAVAFAVTLTSQLRVKTGYHLHSPPWRPILGCMNDVPDSAVAPAGWLEALAESEAELAAGLTVPAEVVHQRIRESIARIEAKRAAIPQREAPFRR